jgi:hypothetical protein
MIVVEITDTVFAPELATYMLPLAESKAIPYGCTPTSIGPPITLLV